MSPRVTAPERDKLVMQTQMDAERPFRMEGSLSDFSRTWLQSRRAVPDSRQHFLRSAISSGQPCVGRVCSYPGNTGLSQGAQTGSAKRTAGDEACRHHTVCPAARMEIPKGSSELIRPITSMRRIPGCDVIHRRHWRRRAHRRMGRAFLVDWKCGVL